MNATTTDPRFINNAQRVLAEAGVPDVDPTELARWAQGAAERKRAAYHTEEGKKLRLGVLVDANGHVLAETACGSLAMGTYYVTEILADDVTDASRVLDREVGMAKAALEGQLDRKVAHFKAWMLS